MWGKHLLKKLAWVGAALGMSYAPQLHAQDNIDQSGSYQSTSYQSTYERIRPERITLDQSPRIDGDLSDPVWRTARVIDEFYQVNPVQGGAPSERTELRIIYSETHLYIGAQMYARDPAKITANVMTRDTNIELDDYIQIFIDSFNTTRDSHFFMVSPTGARRDGLTENNRKFSPEWDTIWNAKTQITDKGWSAEIAIPFRSFGYDRNAPDWGFQIRRRIAADNEDIAWSQITQDLPDYDVSGIGRIEGITDVAVGKGLDVQGFVTAGAQYDWESREAETTLDPSANIYYRFTPALTGALTLNTDFSDTPLDARQVNTNRFSLFFPETREFFLQDQNLFAFGGRPFRNPNGLPFFSRRIGLVSGAPVDIEAGAKLSGSLGPVNLGALTTRTADQDNLQAQTLSVLRASVDVAQGSRVGAIFTDGDPRGLSDSRVWGFDGQYKSTTLISGKQFAADAYYLKSESDVDTRSGESYGFEVAYPNDAVNGYFRFKHLDDSYAPALGFANRTGIRDYDSQLRFRKRYKDSDVRYDSLGLFGNVVTDVSNERESSRSGAYLQRNWQNGANLFLFGFADHDRLDSVFNLPGGASVPIGTYDFARGSVVYSTPTGRKWRLRSEVECCDFYDGDRLLLDFDAEFRPSKHFNLSASYRYNDISVSGGDTDIHVVGIDANINITPDMQIINQLQYDNISEGLGYFGRFRWAIRAQTELLVTYSHGAQTDFDSFRSVQSGLSVRLGNTYRF